MGDKTKKPRLKPVLLFDDPELAERIEQELAKEQGYTDEDSEEAESDGQKTKGGKKQKKISSMKKHQKKKPEQEDE